MNDTEKLQQIDLSVDLSNLYREESVTDLKVASIRRLIPINEDGTGDASRDPIFIGHAQLMSPQGPLPIQARLNAKTLSEAIKDFPGSMKMALREMAEKLKQYQQQQMQQKQKEESRIIVPKM